MVILKTIQSLKSVTILLGSGAGKFFKKAIEIGGIGKIEFIGDLLCRPVEPELLFYFGNKPVMDHLLCRKSAVLPADCIEMCGTDPEHFCISCNTVLVPELLFQQ